MVSSGGIRRAVLVFVSSKFPILLLLTKRGGEIRIVDQIRLLLIRQQKNLSLCRSEIIKDRKGIPFQ